MPRVTVPNTGIHAGGHLLMSLITQRQPHKTWPTKPVTRMVRQKEAISFYQAMIKPPFFIFSGTYFLSVRQLTQWELSQLKIAWANSHCSCLITSIKLQKAATDITFSFSDWYHQNSGRYYTDNQVWPAIFWMQLSDFFFFLWHLHLICHVYGYLMSVKNSPSKKRNIKSSGIT